MRVVLLTPLFLPVRGGTEVHVYNLAKHLTKLGVSVEVHASRDTYTQRNVLPEREVIDGLEVIRHKSGWSLEGDYDLVHFHNMHRLFTFWNVKTVLHTALSSDKKVFTPHHSMIPDRPYPVRALQKLLVSKFDRWIAVSEWEKEEMARKGFSVRNAVVIPNGVEDEAFELPPQEPLIEGEYLLYLGRISPEKNQLWVIECLKDWGSSVKLVLAGEVRDERYFSEVKRELNGNAMYLGKVDQRTKYALIDNALAVVLTSTIEAEGIAVKEAFVRGTPAIVAKWSGGATTLIRDGYNGFLVGSCEEFRRAVEELRKRREEISKKAREGTEAFRWENVARRTLEVYMEVLKE
jgi:glycosyltransferase involved in cell wall biosynthesis